MPEGKTISSLVRFIVVAYNIGLMIVFGALSYYTFRVAATSHSMRYM